MKRTIINRPMGVVEDGISGKTAAGARANRISGHILPAAGVSLGLLLLLLLFFDDVRQCLGMDRK